MATDRDGPAERDAAFSAIYVGERPAITRLAFLVVRSMPVAEELAQETFTRLYERFGTVPHPPGFLRTVVVRLAIGWLRRHDMERQRLTVVGAGHPGVGGPELDETWPRRGGSARASAGARRRRGCPPGRRTSWHRSWAGRTAVTGPSSSPIPPTRATRAGPSSSNPAGEWWPRTRPG